ncbi:MAG: hypothetical protein IJV07_05305 [Alphaproteobacteria bacterium]|nr:hypothetical protein [Alphaproteobacteria bacterium]
MWSCSDDYATTLGSNLNGYYVWTTDMHDSCTAFTVRLRGGDVGGNYRHDGNYRAALSRSFPPFV